jgi:lipopolysaccharide/colanic/teichoic acid biosynthesis glycosyltransferase
MNLKLRQWILSADLLWIVMSVGLVQLLQNGLTPEPEALAPSVYASAVLVAASIWTVLYFSKNLEGYCLGWYLPRVFAQVILGVFYVMGSLLAFGFLSKHFYSRLALLYLACLLPVGFITIRCLAWWLVQSQARMRTKRRVVIVGSGSLVHQLLVKIARHPEASMEVAGVLYPTDAEPSSQPLSFGPGTVSVRTLNILDLMQKKSVQELILVEPLPPGPETEELISGCRKAGLKVYLVPLQYQLYLSKARLTEIEDVPLLSLEEQTLSPVGLQLKRAMDFWGALCLLVLSTPFLAFSAALLRWNRGKAFRRELRCGRNETPFWMYRLNVDRDAPTQDGYERGLVELSLTELPQLLNVLKGEMSLVGPRPEPRERVKHYSMWQRQRLTVKPGLTGLAQVHGLREQHSSEEKVHFDLQYISHWSLFLDLSLVLQTTWTLLLRLVHENRLATRPLVKPTIDTHLGIGKIWNANRTQSRAH